MSTYIQGVTDYIPQIQPFQPDYNFYGNVMQTRQTRYDSAKKSINDLYGSLLNSPLTKDSNIKRREEFFKVIDQDIKKISGMDLSLQQNVDQAANVFKGLSEDKYITNDMIWTKRFNNAVQKHEMLQNCFDPEKCGGQAWNEGYQELMYKREEFRNAGDEESLNMQAPQYTPYFNWQKEAKKLAKDSGLSVTVDHSNGKYILRDKNGDLVQGGLYKLFTDTYGNDPRVKANYSTLAYVDRKNAIRSTASLYGSEEEAERIYLQNTINEGIKTLRSNIEDINNGYNQLDSLKVKLEKQKNTKGLSNSEEQYYQKVVAERNSLLSSKKTLEDQISEVEANMKKGDRSSLFRSLDTAKAAHLLNKDLSSMAEVLSHVDEEHTIQKEDVYAKAAYDHKLAKDLKKYEHELGMIRDAVQSNLRIQEEEYKTGAKVKPGQPEERGTVIESPAGSNIAELEMLEHPHLFYEMNAQKSANNYLQAGNNESNIVLWDAFIAAKQDGGVGAMKYLNSLYGKKWENVKSIEDLAALTANNPYIYMKKTTNFLGERMNDVLWGKDVLNKNNKTIADIEIKKAAAASQMKMFKAGADKVLQNMADSKHPIYKYAKEMTNTSGNVDSGEKVTPKFIKAYLKDNPNASIGEINDAYEETKKEFYIRYHGAPKEGTDHAYAFTGGNGLAFSKIDPAVDNKINSEISSVLTQSFNNPGSYKVVSGNASAESFKKESDPTMEAFMNQFALDIKNKNPKDSNRPIYRGMVQGIAADKEGQSSITIKPSKDYVDKYFGNSKEVTESGIKDQVLRDGVTFFFDNKLVKSEITKGMESSPIEKILIDKGSYKVNSFKNTAGSLNIKYNPLTKETVIEPTYIEYTENEPIVRTAKPIAIYDIRNVQDNVNYLLSNFEQLQNINLAKEEQNRLVNKLKFEK